VSDFETATLETDWRGIAGTGGSGGPLAFTFAGATANGIWAARFSQLSEMEEQLRDERRFTIFTTFSELAATPAARMTLARSGLTYFIEAIRNDAELIGIELDVKQIF
jgi:hypothetical protein